MPEVLKIENESFEFNWTEDDFLACLGSETASAWWPSTKTRRGFMIYELHKTRLHILNFAVAPALRRLAVGAQMIEKLINKTLAAASAGNRPGSSRDEPGCPVVLPEPGIPRERRVAQPLFRFRRRRIRHALPSRRRSRGGRYPTNRISQY